MALQSRGRERSGLLDVALFRLLIKGAFERLCTAIFQILALTPSFVPPNFGGNIRNPGTFSIKGKKARRKFCHL